MGSSPTVVTGSASHAKAHAKARGLFPSPGMTAKSNLKTTGEILIPTHASEMAVTTSEATSGSLTKGEILIPTDTSKIVVTTSEATFGSVPLLLPELGLSRSMLPRDKVSPIHKQGVLMSGPK